jgi:hypothetical protein
MQMQGQGFVTKLEYHVLEQRVIRAEQLIRAQNEQIKTLKERLDYLNTGVDVASQQSALTMQLMRAGVGAMGAGAMGAGAYGAAVAPTGRDASRTPRGPMGTKPPLPVCVDPSQLPSLEEFGAQNMLDSKCIENMRSQPIEVQQFVIGRGPAEGTNPSAMITARIAKCAAEYSIGENSSGDIINKVEELIATCSLDENVANALRGLKTDGQMAVLSLGPAGGTNPSAMVQARIAKWNRGRL